MSMLSAAKKKTLSVVRAMLANNVYETSYGSVKIKRKGGLGFLTNRIRHATPEEVFLTSLDLKGKTVYDIGGYIGLLATVFAKGVGPEGRVVVFEPNEGNCSKIQEHLRLNRVDNATLLKLGIGDAKSENKTLVVRRNSTATGSMDEKIQSQIIEEGEFDRLQIDVDTLDGAMTAHGLPKPDFIKIDIEGMEYPALLGMHQTMQNHSPQFYIEIHGADEASKCENIHKIVELLLSRGYSILHVESQQEITMNNHTAAKEGHVFCRRAL